MESIRRTTLEKISAFAGIGAGIAGASAIGTAVGSVGVLGSIGSAVGLTVAITTPIGWLVGGAALGATVLYGGSKAIGAKGFSDGDNKAHRIFNSDIEKKLYARLTTKLSYKDTIVAKRLLCKISDEFSEWRDSALDGLDKGTMPATDIITMCCELLEEDVSKHLDGNNFSSTKIEQTIRFAVLMALSDGDVTNDELQVIRDHIVKFFALSPLLDDTEIDLIFSQANGSEEQQEQLKKMSFEDIQVTFVAFFLLIQDDRLKKMMLDFLAEIACADGEISNNEVILYTQFKGLLNAEKNLDSYLEHLENFLKAQNDLLLSRNGNGSEVCEKKIKNALASYAKGIPPERVMCLYDSTLFGKADKGFIVTPLSIITNNCKNMRVIPLGSIYHMAFEDKDRRCLLLYGKSDNDDMVLIAELKCPIEKLKEFNVFLEKVIEVNIAISP